MAQAAKPQTQTTKPAPSPATPLVAQSAPPRPGSVFTDFASI